MNKRWVQRMTNLAGSTAHERKIWNSYLCTARQAVDAGTLSDPSLEMSRDRARLPSAREDALEAIVFTAFALEYRIRHIFDALAWRLAPEIRLALWFSTFARGSKGSLGWMESRSGFRSIGIGWRSVC